MADSFSQRLTQAWYRGDKKLLCLRPLSMLYQHIAQRRAQHLKSKAWHAPVPVIIVGNITVGGSGKTPAVIAIADALRQRGETPGIISRGYKSRAPRYPYLVTADSPVTEAGDEPLLIAQRTQCPVMIGAARKPAIQKLLAEHNCSLIISDDGLQHYRLQRDIEVCVVDMQRGFGNRRCLPEGPLREPLSRLEQVDFILSNGSSELAAMQGDHCFLTQVLPLPLRDVSSDKETQFLQQDVHAVAGIAGPERFFNSLRSQGFNIIEHRFPDHHNFREEDFIFTEQRPIVMTEKDAVKCRALSLSRAYYQPIALGVDESFYTKLHARLQQIKQKKQTRVTP